MFKIGDIVELNHNTLMYDKDLICQVMEIDEDNTNYGYVKILKYPDGKGSTDQRKHANLTLFKLVERKIFYV